MLSEKVDPVELESLAKQANADMERLFDEFSVDDIKTYQSNREELEMLQSKTKELEEYGKQQSEEIASLEAANRVITGLVSFFLSECVHFCTMWATLSVRFNKKKKNF